MPGHSLTKDDITKRLRRIEGQVRGVAQMVEDDRYCIDLLTQVSAITKALEAVAVGLLDEHLRHCVVVAAGSSDDTERTLKIDEATAAIRRLIAS
jgi:CsoR family transcriptional regulator, copper-sensing transcriptional repressor